MNKRLKTAKEKHDKWLASMGFTGKPKKPKGIYDIPDYKTKRVTSDQIPGNGNAMKRNVYTGNEIAGIATTHKSNLVPIRKDNLQAAKDVANMRRN